MKYLSTLFLVGAALSGCGLVGEKSQVKVAEYTGPEEAATLLRFVKQQVPAKRQAVLYFYADWCGPCRRFRASLTDKQVGAALQNATLVKLNIDNYPQFAADLDVAFIPAFLKLDSAGNVVAHISSDKWKEDVPENIAPVMSRLVNGHAYDLQP